MNNLINVPASNEIYTLLEIFFVFLRRGGRRLIRVGMTVKIVAIIILSFSEVSSVRKLFGGRPSKSDVISL